MLFSSQKYPADGSFLLFCVDSLQTLQSAADEQTVPTTADSRKLEKFRSLEDKRPSVLEFSSKSESVKLGVK